MIAFPEVMRIKSRIRTGKAIMTPAPKTCSVLERRCGDFEDNVVGAVFVAYADLANSATSRGPLRQVYRIRGIESVSAVLTVQQTASPCEEMRKSLRTCGVTRLKQVPDCHRAGRDDACRDRRIGPTASHMLAFGNPGWADSVGCCRLGESNGKPWDGSRFAWDSVGTRGAAASDRQRARLILSSGKE
jgi:hypothetical protein